MVGEPYKRYRGDEHFDAIVIGSGIGGLTAAVLLGHRGKKKVLVLERHYTAGGFTHTFRRPGYEWDVGLHYIGDVTDPDAPTRRLFDAVTGGRLQWAPMPETYDRIILGDRSYDLVAGPERFRERLKSYFPSDTSAIDRYLETVKQAVVSNRLFFAEKVVPRPISALFGGLMRRKFLRLAGRTTREVLEGLTSNQELIGVLTGQYGDYGLPPGQSSFGIHAMVVNHYLKGGAYPVGGSSRIAAEATREIEGAGGKLLIGAEVSRILVEGGRATGVEMADSRTIRAPLVISDAGVFNTFGSLLPGNHPIVADWRAGIERIGASCGHLCLYVGLRHSDEELGLRGTNLWIYPDEKHDENLAHFLADPDQPVPLFYISFPSAKDPTFQERFPGRATIEVLTVGEYDWFLPWENKPWRKRGADYEALKHRFSRRLLGALQDHVPQVEGKIDFHELSSPLSTRRFVSYPRGEIYGLAHTPERFKARFLRPRTGIKGLYLTGQDVCSCGVTGAMIGGGLTASAILGRNVLPSRPRVATSGG